MICNRNTPFVLALLVLPAQYSFLSSFNNDALSRMKLEWTKYIVTNFQLKVYDQVTMYTGIVGAIVAVFLFYLFNKRPLISIMLFIDGVVWLVYLAVSEERFWLGITLRAIQGIFLGFFSVSCAPYIFHFATEENFGFHGCMIQVSMFFALVVINLFFYCMTWKTVPIACSVISIISSGLIWLVPECKPIPKKRSNEYIFDKKYRFEIFVMVMTMIFQQVSGIVIMINNLARMMSSIGLKIHSNLQSALMNMVGCIATFIAAFISDAVGRRRIWAISCAGVVVGLVIFGVTLKVPADGWIGTLGIFVYFLFYGLGIGPIPWYLCGEFFPEPVRIEAAGITTLTNTIFSIIMQTIFPYLTEGMTEFGTIILFAATSLIGLFFGFYLIREVRRGDFDGVTIM